MSKKLLLLISSIYLASCFLLGNVMLDAKSGSEAIQALVSKIDVMKVREAKANDELKTLKENLNKQKKILQDAQNKPQIQTAACNTGSQPLGMRYCNPGNVKKLSNGKKYAGQIGVGKSDFIIFADKVFGIRAIGLVLLSYQYTHKIDTVEKIIYRYSKTDRQKYISFICKKLGVQPNEKISIKDNLPKLLECIVTFEVGHKHEKTIPDEMYVLAAKGAIMDKTASSKEKKKS